MLKKKFREIRIKDQVWIHKNTIKDEKKNENLNLDPSFGIHNCMSVPGPSPNCFCLCCLAKAHSICFCSRISFIKSWSSMLHLLLPWREIPALKGSCLFWGKKLKKKKAVKNMQNAFPDASEESRHALALGQLLALGELKALVADPHVQSSENNGCLWQPVIINSFQHKQHILKHWNSSRRKVSQSHPHPHIIIKALFPPVS